MNFNETLYKISEDFTAPVDSGRVAKKRPSGKFGTINPQLNEPHSTASTSGFKGQPGGKMRTMMFSIPSDEEDSSLEITINKSILKTLCDKLETALHDS